MRLVFDIETSMLDREDPKFDPAKFSSNVKDLACICAIDVDTGEDYTWHDNEDLERDGDILDGLMVLLESDLLIGHNIKGFDIPAIVQLYPNLKDRFDKVKAFDTLKACRQLFTWKWLVDYDVKHEVQHSEYSAKALNSLGAWGDRFKKRLGLDLAKDEEFKKNVDWSKLTPATAELISYCLQDVVVNVEIYRVALKTYNHNKKKREAEDA